MNGEYFKESFLMWTPWDVHQQFNVLLREQNHHQVTNPKVQIYATNIINSLVDKFRSVLVWAASNWSDFKFLTENCIGSATVIGVLQSSF